MASTGGSQYFPLANEITFRIGAFNGAIDDFAAYNRQLSYEEIQALYADSSTPNPPTACNPLPTNLQNGLVGYWPFCGNANDESGNGNDGTVNGATLTDNRFGEANSSFGFIGSNIVVNDAASIGSELINEISLNAWITIDGFPDGFVPVISKDGPVYHQYELFLEPQSIGFWSTNIYDSAPTVPFEFDRWYMITLTYNAGIANYYVDGSLILSHEVNNSTLVASSANLEFGSDSPNGIQYHEGNIDDIAIYNRALTADEVQQLYTLNACTFTIYDTVTVTQTVYDTVSVSVSTTDTLIINTLITAVQPAQENTFLVYPNPAGSQITINNGNVGILGGYTLRISNSAGQEVYNQNITQNEVTLDLIAWGGNGLYVLYIVDPQGEIIAVKQIVLQ